MANDLRIEFLINWIAALRSGEYIQGFHGLHKHDSKGNDTHCVLGVGCDVARKMGYGKWVRLRGNSDNAYEYDGEIQYCFPPDRLMRVINLKDNPVLLYKKTRTYMSILNNFDRVTFKEFADLIEQQILPICQNDKTIIPED